MADEKIEVYYKPLPAGGYHKYLVYTKADGSQESVSFGPTEPGNVISPIPASSDSSAATMYAKLDDWGTPNFVNPFGYVGAEIKPYRKLIKNGNTVTQDGSIDHPESVPGADPTRHKELITSAPDLL